MRAQPESTPSLRPLDQHESSPLGPTCFRLFHFFKRIRNEYSHFVCQYYLREIGLAIARSSPTSRPPPTTSPPCCHIHQAGRHSKFKSPHAGAAASIGGTKLTASHPLDHQVRPVSTNGSKRRIIHRFAIQVSLPINSSPFFLPFIRIADRDLGFWQILFPTCPIRKRPRFLGE